VSGTDRLEGGDLRKFSISSIEDVCVGVGV
jgi:hypothetical protein